MLRGLGCDVVHVNVNVCGVYVVYAMHAVVYVLRHCLCGVWHVMCVGWCMWCVCAVGSMCWGYVWCVRYVVYVA